MKLFIPSYFYPGPTWDTLLDSDLSALSDVIINPNSGSGDTADSEYFNLCVNLRKKGVSTLGYVSTQWGKRFRGSILTDIAQYRQFYGVHSIFLDEVSTDEDDLDFYRDLYEKIPGKVVLNHGTIPDESYFEAGDMLVIFESEFAKLSAKQFPHWLKKHRSKICQIIFDCPAQQMKAALRKSSIHASYVYVTDDTDEDGNPYDSLPSYWSKLLKACK